MKKLTPHIDFRALFLAVLMLFAFGAKEAHHFFNHSHHEVKICADASNNTTHLHGEDYIPHECQLCDFTFSVFDFSVPIFTVKSLITAYNSSVFTYISFIYSHSHLFQSLRAPPFGAVV